MIPPNTPQNKAGTVADATTLAAMYYAFSNPAQIQGVGYWAVIGMILIAVIRVIPVLVDAYIRIHQARTQQKAELLRQEFIILDLQKKREDLTNEKDDR